MKYSLSKTALKLSIVASLVLTSISAQDALEVNALATTQEVYALGLSYGLNDNIKIGVGGLSINGVESSLTTAEDSLLGGYAIVEFKYPLIERLEFFVDAVYIGGKLDNANESVSKAVGAGGLKYNLDKFSLFAGYTTEDTGFGGIDYNIDDKWKLTLGGSYNNDYDESQAIIGISYNFGSGMNSVLTTSAKYVSQDEYHKFITSDSFVPADIPSCFAGTTWDGSRCI